MDIARRDVLMAGLAAAASAAGGRAPLAAAAARSPSGLDGELRWDRATRAAAADDFGHIVHRTPAAVLLPESERDIATVIGWARRLGGKVAPQGQSHSVWGRSQVGDQGVVVDLSTRHSVGRVQRDRVVVDAGAKWSAVLAATLPHGRTPPVLCDYLELSVGGTLSVGGVGGTTSLHGVQSDNVIAMEVVTGKGQTVTCSATRNRELFDAVRAGLGQVGVITRATLRLVAAPREVRRFLLSYPDLPTMLRDARLLARDDRFDAVQGAILPTPTGGLAFRLDAAKLVTGAPSDDAALLTGLADDPARRQATTISYFDYLNRLAPLESALRENGQWFLPHPWLTTFVGDSHVESVVQDELSRLDPANDLGRFGQIVLSPISRSAASSPLLRLPADRLCFAFNLIRIPATADIHNANRLVAANRAIYERVRRAGGTLYPVSAFPMSRRDWRRHFGPAFNRLRDAKRRYDPDDVLTPGYEVF
jgi:cytokinin dehydrogenase